MVEKKVLRSCYLWGSVLLAAVALIFAATEWQRSSLFRSNLARLLTQNPNTLTQEYSLPDYLVAVTNAEYASLEGLARGSRKAQKRQRYLVEEFGFPLEVKTRKTGIVFRLIPPGTFEMGSPWFERGRIDKEKQHKVTIPKPFYCGKFEVTQGQFEQVMGEHWSSFKNAGKDAPVESVGWHDCIDFLKELRQIEGVPEETTFWLPIEADWEYACRAGTKTPFCYGKDLDSSMANFDGLEPYGKGRKGENRNTTVKVGSFRPNAWGLYDMHGNVEEWCLDHLTSPPFLGFHALRGGSWGVGASSCRSADRGWWIDDFDDSFGFRIVIVLQPPN